MEPLLAAGSALWLGILTSISPCPLASNVAAVSYVGRNAGAPAGVLLSGLAYSAGRAVTYAAVAGVVVTGLLAVPSVSFFLQERMNQVLGPLLILVGAVMLGLLRVPWSFGRSAGGLEQRLARGGIAGAAGLGMVFALSFCPVSAGLFFGALLPLATAARSPVVLPLVYGLGTGLPVLAFALLLALGARGVGRLFRALSGFDRIAGRVTGAVFVLAGLYLSMTHLLGVSL